ncbi:MAG: LamG domain-containing protein [Planctomycetaceae bacterium]|jgi:hypothetical protein|nr:LamG domain-containing protein [Planctomycetaceae bacterium]
MFTFIKNLFVGKQNGGGAARLNGNRKLGLESLESRELLSVSPIYHCADVPTTPYALTTSAAADAPAYISAVNLTTLDNSDQITFYARFTTASDLSGSQYLLAHDCDSNQGDELYLRITDGVLQFGTWDSISDFGYEYASLSVTAGQTYSVFGVFNNGTMDLYANSTTTHTDHVSSIWAENIKDFTTLSPKWYVGRNGENAAPQAFNGEIYEVAIYNAAFEEWEVNDEFQKDNWKVSLVQTETGVGSNLATATERLAGVEQDYGTFKIKREVADGVVGNTSYAVNVDFAAAIEGKAYSADNYVLKYQNAGGGWNDVFYDTGTGLFTATIAAGQTEVNLRLYAPFDWLDEGTLFNPFGTGTPKDDLGEFVNIVLDKATWEHKAGTGNALGIGTIGSIEIKDGAIVKIVTDSNNDGIVDASDDDSAIKNGTSVAGKVLRVNNDDDDANGVKDKEQRPASFNTANNPAALAGTAPSTTVEYENDLAEVLLYVWVDSLVKGDGSSYTFDVFSEFPTDMIMWTQAEKGSRLHRGVEASGRITENTRLKTLSENNNTFNRTVYIEANNAVTGTVDLKVQPVLGTPGTTVTDKVKIAGIDFGLTPYTPQTQYIAPIEIPEAKWKANAVGIRRNSDFDSGNTLPDWSLGTATTQENDLVRMDIAVSAVSGIEYKIRTSATLPDVRLWNSLLKGGNPVYTVNGGSVIAASKTVYAEYISSGNASVTFELVAILTATGQELYTEEITFRPFNSVTVAFVGETQQAGNPDGTPAGSLGVNDWVVQELKNGYDVWVFDDGYDVITMASPDCTEWGEGNALDVVANAINNQGIANVAIIGYSHGGGSAYNLSWRMFYDGGTSDSYLYWYPPQVINNPYNVVFTSYIDAVSNSYSLDNYPENRRPLGTQWHTNQYETNSDTGAITDVFGCSIPTSDDNIDRSSLGVYHWSGTKEESIDRNSVVQNFLTTRFEQEVSR